MLGGRHPENRWTEGRTGTCHICRPLVQRVRARQLPGARPGSTLTACVPLGECRLLNLLEPQFHQL